MPVGEPLPEAEIAENLSKSWAKLETNAGPKSTLAVLRRFAGTVHRRLFVGVAGRCWANLATGQARMMLLIPPSFEGNADQIRRLAELTGLVQYDIKTRLRPGSWSVLRLLADPEEAEALHRVLSQHGIPTVVVDSMVAFDQARRIVRVDALSLDGGALSLSAAGQSMRVDPRVLLVVVRGEIRSQPAAWHERRPSSSANLKAVVPSTAEVQVFRERAQPEYVDTFPGADLHFATVQWVARIDARVLDFALLGIDGPGPLAKIETLADELAAQAQVRVDRSFPHSSLASFSERRPPLRTRTPSPNGPPSSPRSFEHQPFDGYSRLVGEAERIERGWVVS